MVKALETGVNPKGRSQEVIESKLALSKVVAKASDKMLESKGTLAKSEMANLAKVIKRANEKLTVSFKKEL
jgi:hypothetical protein